MPVLSLDPMKTLCLLAATFLLTAATPFAAEQTWTGQISDSLCGAKHEEAAEGQGLMSDSDCTLSCVRGGSKFVLVVDGGKMVQIVNQDNTDLVTHAGHKVRLTGELQGQSIVISKIEMQ